MHFLLYFRVQLKTNEKFTSKTRLYSENDEVIHETILRFLITITDVCAIMLCLSCVFVVQVCLQIAGKEKFSAALMKGWVVESYVHLTSMGKY